MYISTNFLTLIRGAGNLSKHSSCSHQPSHLGQVLHSLLLKVEVEVFSTHCKTHERDDDQALHLDFNLVLHFFRLGSHWRGWPSSVFSILFRVFLAKALYLSNEFCIIFAKVQTIFETGFQWRALASSNNIPLIDHDHLISLLPRGQIVCWYQLVRSRGVVQDSPLGRNCTRGEGRSEQDQIQWVTRRRHNFDRSHSPFDKQW